MPFAQRAAHCGEVEQRGVFLAEVHAVGEPREPDVVVDDRDAARGAHARDDRDQRGAVDSRLRADLHEADPAAQQRLGERDRLGAIGIDQRVDAVQTRTRSVSAPVAGSSRATSLLLRVRRVHDRDRDRAGGRRVAAVSRRRGDDHAVRIVRSRSRRCRAETSTGTIVGGVKQDVRLVRRVDRDVDGEVLRERYGRQPRRSVTRGFRTAWSAAVGVRDVRSARHRRGAPHELVRVDVAVLRALHAGRAQRDRRAREHPRDVRRGRPSSR